MSFVNEAQFVANFSAGMEKLVKEEIREFGGQAIEDARGVVTWCGSLATAYKACLWSRFSSRILLKIISFEVTDFDSLYEGCKKIDWLKHVNSKTTFAVSCTVAENSVLNHSHFAALRVKDAVVDCFREKGCDRPQVQKDRPGVRIHLYVKGRTASLYIDMSGESLHRRGYRDATGIAPLKETLAAAIVALAGWNSSISASTVFLDPMCGSGTLLIEAALIYGDAAPGLSRQYYGFSRWLGHDQQLWTQIVDEAVEREERGLEKKWPSIIGYDSDPVLVAVARKNIEKAGLSERIHVKCAEVGRLKKPARLGYIVSNLPYGERLSEKEEVKHLYRAIGRIVTNNFVEWKTGLFISQPDLADKFNMKWQQSYKLYNGPISCRLLTGSVERQEQLPFQWKLSAETVREEGGDFANRLRKNFKKLKRWSQKNNVSCFRVYDRDLPEYNVTIDIYEKRLLLQEFSAPSTVKTEAAEKRFSLVLKHIRDILNIKRDRLYIKKRIRQKGKKQYQKRDAVSRYYEIREENIFFLVNFSNYLDTGIFLDHRPVRKKIAQLATGKRFLNLFGYTGTATVHAVKGGAILTSTIDLSSHYLNWARMNLALNGFSGQNNEMIQDDAISWLKETKSMYDLIFVDPPTFSNTKKKGRVFDVQRDHEELITLAMSHLEENGLLIFSTNFRKFRLGSTIERLFTVKDISAETIPFDFQRNKQIHKCWEIRKGNCVVMENN